MVPRKPQPQKPETQQHSPASEFSPPPEEAAVEGEVQPTQSPEEIASIKAHVETLEDSCESLKAQTQDLNERLMRCHAERENERGRMQREMRNARDYALSDFAKELVTVADHLERGLDNGDPDDATQQSFLEGMQLTYDAFMKVLAKYNIEQVNPQDQPFDPDFHEAVSSQPAPDGIATNTVLTVIQRGYVIKDRLVRPALVVVAK